MHAVEVFSRNSTLKKKKQHVEVSKVLHQNKLAFNETFRKCYQVI